MNIFPHTLPSIRVMVTGEDKTLNQKQALERIWLIPSSSVTIFKIRDRRALNSIFKILRFPKHKFTTTICSSLLQLPEELSRMGETEEQVHSWDPTLGQSLRNSTKPWVKPQTLCLATSTYPCKTHRSAWHHTDTQRLSPSLRSLQSHCNSTDYIQRHEGIQRGY